jgi:hypothetical protein
MLFLFSSLPSGLGGEGIFSLMNFIVPKKAALFRDASFPANLPGGQASGNIY